MDEKKPRSATMRWLSPSEDSSWLQLRWTLGVWIALGLFWISWQFWGDGSTLRRIAGALVILVAVVRSLDTVGLMHKKRRTPRRR